MCIISDDVQSFKELGSLTTKFGPISKFDGNLTVFST